MGYDTAVHHMPCVHSPATCLLPRRSARFGALALALSLALAAPLGAAEPLKAYATLTLKDGRHFSAVEVINYTANGLLVRHAQGATTFRFEVLPDDVVAALHLRGMLAFAANNREQAEASLADRPAIPDPALLAIADQPAIAAPQETPAAAIANLPENLADLEAVAAPTMPATHAPAATLAANAAPTPSGEGNIPEFSGVQPVVLNAPPPSREDVAGRLVVTQPASGTHFLGDVEVRGYPASLLTAYLAEAKGKAAAAARKLHAEAALAAQTGRLADQQALAARAEKTARRYLDFLPAAPVSTRSDEFGFFTLQHSLADLRIVATGQVREANGEWNYEWVGVTPEKELHLTETNATGVTAVNVNAPKYAIR